jgi:hypothetical protein
MKYRGYVRRKVVRSGTKSQHEALVLVTTDAEYKLRRQGGNPFWDDVLAVLEDKEIEAEGEVLRGELFLTSWQVV